VIYLDSSVALAWLLSETRAAPDSMWNDDVVSSRLLEYEVWNRIHARQLGRKLGEQTQALLNRIDFVELTPLVLARAVEPFPVPVRTLDALHLASVEYVRSLGQSIALASFDQRLNAAARALTIELYEL